jgi:hypothetical protein
LEFSSPFPERPLAKPTKRGRNVFQRWNILVDPRLRTGIEICPVSELIHDPRISIVDDRLQESRIFASETMDKQPVETDGFPDSVYE